MEAYLLDWVNLLVRWAHVIVGIAWIGASFYFIWLDNHLEPSQDQKLAGELWAIHGGGFYYVEKYKVAPAKLPDHLHWFKWEAYMTWISGVSLLAVVYYFNASGNWTVRDGYLHTKIESSTLPSLMPVGFAAAWKLKEVTSKEMIYASAAGGRTRVESRKE